jgi:hypothetical protein
LRQWLAQPRPESPPATFADEDVRGAARANDAGGGLDYVVRLLDHQVCAEHRAQLS